MELSKDVIEGLSNISNVNIIGEDNFLQILDTVISHLQESIIETNCIVKAADSKAILTKKIFADVLCLFVEAAQHDLDEESLKNLLHQTCTNEQRRKKLCEAYINNKKTIQSRLELIGNNPPHIIDVDWHLDYRVKLDTCNSLGVPLYHVRLSTKEHERINHITFSCTIQQLQELVFKLKDAIRYSEKLTNV
ncbi:COMM domain-containing protein 3 [Nomia melanderi]|uniref:COMM domain-containing protein 3 n=1 Tax=Nomia melanderi TaxID=2448451 RepID=UPI00130413B9|nr:COMM domain-containing protein 3-like [Nomia melanderi]XP_031837741.1 COMM domain-containing protein 3-like [Nomia melanderi]XP_031837742.1 COMM domain-containing protein 3-like [Nomia melanderi]XP_031837744.1 COMM domain-containing protein 3-like [Nomia melanderi]XP_031837745.1 COMM domain-containing protein 3-like [Nomia melanderi]XP_031837746.1 COMM domain-containing protein 3-like [Nomia melanderi]XP_031837747.1 COMM domain-containing protein 3-like [Nomia melanderi]XP_031837748.1 COM